MFAYSVQKGRKMLEKKTKQGAFTEDRRDLLMK